MGIGRVTRLGDFLHFLMNKNFEVTHRQVATAVGLERSIFLFFREKATRAADVAAWQTVEQNVIHFATIVTNATATATKNPASVVSNIIFTNYKIY